jgi:hypothetical protein
MNEWKFPFSFKFPAADLRELAQRHYEMYTDTHGSHRCILSSRLLSLNITMRINKTIILPVALYGCETWSLTLGAE